MFPFHPNDQHLSIPVRIRAEEELLRLSLSEPQNHGLYGLGSQPFTDVFIQDTDGIFVDTYVLVLNGCE